MKDNKNFFLGIIFVYFISRAILSNAFQFNIITNYMVCIIGLLIGVTLRLIYVKNTTKISK